MCDHWQGPRKGISFPDIFFSLLFFFFTVMCVLVSRRREANSCGGAQRRTAPAWLLSDTKSLFPEQRSARTERLPFHLQLPETLIMHSVRIPLLSLSHSHLALSRSLSLFFAPVQACPLSLSLSYFFALPCLQSHSTLWPLTVWTDLLYASATLETSQGKMFMCAISVNYFYAILSFPGP